MLDYIEKHTTKRDRVSFALSTHEFANCNEVDLYFLANRLPGTRYAEYEPNLVSRPDVQQEMIVSIEQHAVRLVVLSTLYSDYHENQPGLLRGSTLLDEYLRKRFVPVTSYGMYTILERRP